MTETTRDYRRSFWRTPWKVVLAVVLLILLLGCFGVFIQPLYTGSGDGHGDTGQVSQQ